MTEAAETNRQWPLIVLSPHFDDAVISVGGIMARHAAAGRRVEVHTAYASHPPRLDEVPPRYRRLLIYDQRRSEDRRALGSIGVEPVWLDFCERAVLSPALPRPLGVFGLPRPATLGRFHNLPGLKAHAARLASSPSRPLVLAPLGIGAHIDHAELFLASVLAMLETGFYDRFGFYEDAYAMSGRARRRHFLAALDQLPLGKAPALAGPVALAMLTAMGLAERGPRLEEFLPALVAELQWQAQAFPLEGYAEAKLAAMRLYTSQMRTLGGYRTFSAMVKRWHQSRQDAEWLWTAQASARGRPKVARTGPRSHVPASTLL